MPTNLSRIPEPITFDSTRFVAVLLGFDSTGRRIFQPWEATDPASK